MEYAMSPELLAGLLDVLEDLEDALRPDAEDED